MKIMNKYQREKCKKNGIYYCLHFRKSRNSTQSLVLHKSYRVRYGLVFATTREPRPCENARRPKLLDQTLASFDFRKHYL